MAFTLRCLNLTIYSFKWSKPILYISYSLCFVCTWNVLNKLWPYVYWTINHLLKCLSNSITFLRVHHIMFKGYLKFCDTPCPCDWMYEYLGGFWTWVNYLISVDWNLVTLLLTFIMKLQTLGFLIHGPVNIWKKKKKTIWNSQVCNLINFTTISFIFTIGLIKLFVEN